MKPEPRARWTDGACIAEALGALGVRNLVLAIHDVSFPSLEREDTGRGSPYAEGGRRFLGFVRDLGFNGVQLGPQGETSADNPSPYDGSIFSRSTLSIALAPLAEDGAWGGLLGRGTLDAIVAGRPAHPAGRAHHRYVHAQQRRALGEAYDAFRQRRARGEGEARHIAEQLEAFQRCHAEWLLPGALYEPLCREHDSRFWKTWAGEPAIDRRLWAPAPGEEAVALARRQELVEAHRDEIEAYAFRQLIAHAQHQELRGLASELGLKLYGDLQIGLSPEDIWGHAALFLRGYYMGAPPSRTNPEGQPWSYPLLDPAQYLERGAAYRLVRARMCKMFEDFDGIRIDHPHGLVCPWVYAADTPDPLRAVQQGARLFASPDLPDHPELARHAIVSPAQLDRSLPRYADGWVTSLSPEQIRRYGVLFQAIVDCARDNGRATSDLVCEVLSTMPFPLKAVLDQHGLGRFRVTQKADLKNPGDVYRSENAAPADWIMVGTHDTRPVWLLLDAWRKAGALEEQARYLAERLAPSAGERELMARALAADPLLLAQAKFADLFVSRAANVMIFFSDLLGLTEVYNTPGTVSDANWSLRVPNDYEEDYRDKLARGAALDLPRALAMALRARGGSLTGAERDLIARLTALSARMSRGA